MASKIYSMQDYGEHHEDVHFNDSDIKIGRQF